VRVAGDGAQGVDLFRTWRPHLIWMDLRLMDMDGAETARQIRVLEGGRDVKIVAVSASVFACERTGLLAAGLDDFVGKPYRPKDIFNCMACQLGVRYRERDLASPGVSAPALLPEALAALPETLRAELRDALLALDAGRIAAVIDRVLERDSALGSALARSAGRFAYTAIFQALETTGRNVGTV